VRWRDAAGLAWRGAARRPGRTLLTALAVVLAAALLVALLTIAATARTRVLNQITRGGPLAGITVDGRGLDRNAVERIRGLPHVTTVSPVLAAPADLAMIRLHGRTQIRLFPIRHLHDSVSESQTRPLTRPM